jgi:succinate dehydrogenase / fumarate reductase cytochrome b subunit
MESTYQAPPIPKAFIWRRAHSLTGLWLVIFLVEHLLTNSQAALWIGDDGLGFIRAVNGLKELPYLQVIELLLLGLPLVIHGIWGVKYLLTAKYNSFSTSGSSPSLPQYSRNQAYTWQRITSWILLIAIVAHVIHMRFIEYPTFASVNGQQYYMIKIGQDNGLQTLSKRLGFSLFNQQQINVEKLRVLLQSSVYPSAHPHHDHVVPQTAEEERTWIAAMEKWKLAKNDVIAVAPSFGVAELLMVRDTFKNPVMILLYTGLVLAACFHGFNGLWTFMISWGITLTARSQQLMRSLATGLMLLVTFLGLAAIWGTYWINLRQ